MIKLASGGPRRRRGGGHPHDALDPVVSTEWNDVFSLGHVLLPSNEATISQGADKVLNFEFKGVGYQPKQDSRKDEMTPTLAAKGLIRKAYPLGRYGKIENIVHHVVRFMTMRVTKDFTPRRARAIWEGAARRIDSEEMDALREALVKEHKREAQELRARLAALDEILASHDENQARPSLAAEGP